MKLPAPGAVARSLSAREFRATIRPLRTVRQKPAESFPSILILARQEERESWLSAENFSLQFCKKTAQILLQVWSSRANKPLYYIAVRSSSASSLLFIFLARSIRNGD